MPYHQTIVLISLRYKYGRLVFALEPVKIRLTCQFFVRIVVVLPLREHIIDQPDGQQVEVGDALDSGCHLRNHLLAGMKKAHLHGADRQKII